jgi:hypothetical protein
MKTLMPAVALVAAGIHAAPAWADTLLSAEEGAG